MTGWRIGYTGSSKEIAKIMGSIQCHQTSNPNSIAQKAAYAALSGPQECVEEMRKAFEKRKNYMVDLIKEIPLINCIDPKGAFYLFLNIGETFNKKFRGIPVENSNKFASLLLENYLVALVPGEAFGASDYVRVSYATSMENISNGLERINSFLQELIE
jgi:aspartate aminotransferase